jgi:pSer/pThr/pTyr-binding forkhead associated (FHA) protein
VGHTKCTIIVRKDMDVNALNGTFINRRKENHSTAVYEVLHIQFTVCDVLIINDHTVVVRNKTKIKVMSLL